MSFIDSHVHLSACASPEAILRLARRSRLCLLSCGVDMETSLSTLGYASEEPVLVRAFVGLHPSEAEKDDADLGWLGKAVEAASGVGEVGLDPKYSQCGAGSRQMECFVRQLEVSERWGKPVQVHSRGAERQCLDVLGSHDLGPVLMHWFQGEEELAEVIDRGYFVSYGPALLTSKRLQQMAARVPPGRVLTESDGPVAFSSLGGRSGPSLMPTVVFKLAQIWGRPFQDSAAQVALNSQEFLGTRGKT